MTEAERFKIVSEKYADFITNDDARAAILNAYPDASVSLNYNNLSVIHIPVENKTFDRIHRFGYSSIPACFGL